MIPEAIKGCDNKTLNEIYTWCRVKYLATGALLIELPFVNVKVGVASLEF